MWRRWFGIIVCLLDLLDYRFFTIFPGVQQAMLQVQQAMLQVKQVMLQVKQVMLQVQQAVLCEINHKAYLSPAELELGLSLGKVVVLVFSGVRVLESFPK